MTSINSPQFLWQNVSYPWIFLFLPVTTQLCKHSLIHASSRFLWAFMTFYLVFLPNYLIFFLPFTQIYQPIENSFLLIMAAITVDFSIKNSF